MKQYLPLVAVLVGSTSLVNAGDITGKVTLKGTPKAEVPIDLGPSCGPLNPNKNSVTTRHYVVGKDGGLANVFVYLKDAKGAAGAGDTPVLDQVGCMYEPYVLGVVTGQKFKVKNSDATLHNVHNTPKIQGNKEYNIGQAVKGQMNDFSFDKSEILMRFKCDVHPWMFAYVGVVEHPYFAVTDKDGNFKISGVPDGNYSVVAYHLKTHVGNPGISEAVEVKGSAKKDFTVTLP